MFRRFMRVWKLSRCRLRATVRRRILNLLLTRRSLPSKSWSAVKVVTDGLMSRRCVLKSRPEATKGLIVLLASSVTPVAGFNRPFHPYHST